MAGCWAGGRHNGLEAAVVLGQLGNSLLGSSQSLKCIVGDDNSSVTVSDPVELLKNLDIEHPVGQIIRDTCQSHQKTYGTGTKTLLVLIGIWMKSAMRLREQDVPVRDITQLMHAGIDAILEHLQKMKIPQIWDHFEENSEEEESRKAWNTSGNVEDDTALETGHGSSVIDSSIIAEDASVGCDPFSAISEPANAPGLDLTFQPTSSCDLPLNAFKELSDIPLKTKPQFSSLTNCHDSDDDFADCFDGIPESQKDNDVSEDPLNEDISKFFSKSRNNDSYIINSSHCEINTSVKLPTNQTVASLTLQMKNQPDLDECSDDISWYFESDSGSGKDKGQMDSCLHQMSGIGRNDLTGESSKVTSNMLLKDLSSYLENDFQNADIINFAVHSNSVEEITIGGSVLDRRDIKESLEQTEMRKKMEERQRNLEDVLRRSKPVSLPKLKNCSRHFKTIESTVKLHHVKQLSEAENAYCSIEKPNATDYENVDGFSVLNSTAKNYCIENPEFSSLCAKSSYGECVNGFSIEKTPGALENGMLSNVNQRKPEGLSTQTKLVSHMKSQNCSHHFKTINSTVRSKLGRALCGDKNRCYIKEQEGESKNTSRLHYGFLDLQESGEQILDESVESSSDLFRKSGENDSVLKEMWTTSKESAVKNNRSLNHQLQTHIVEFSTDGLSSDHSICENIVRHFPDIDELKAACFLSDNLKSLESFILESADKPTDCQVDFTEDILIPGVKTVEELAYRLSHGHDLAMRLVMEVYHRHRELRQKDRHFQKPQFDSSRLHTCVTGPGTERASCVREGLLVPVSLDLMIDRSAWRERMAQALLVNGNMSSNSKHTGYKTIKAVTVFSRPRSKVSGSWSQTILQKILDVSKCMSMYGMS
ncbi:uncharacterized protein LOC135477422 [Liolophura sinensis]|uniref:uncharacterized protein LOC135477422 n=1 Tax=Liolophura sinensis TaxID=3198878 RepID=UPI00315876C0